MADLSTDPTTKTITIDNATSILTEIVNVEFDKNIIKYTKTQLKQYDLKILDQIRDVILHKKGNETLLLNRESLGESNNGSSNLQNFIGDITTSQSNKLGGMLLKHMIATSSTTG